MVLLMRQVYSTYHCARVAAVRTKADIVPPGLARLLQLGLHQPGRGRGAGSEEVRDSRPVVISGCSLSASSLSQIRNSSISTDAVVQPPTGYYGGNGRHGRLRGYRGER